MLLLNIISVQLYIFMQTPTNVDPPKRVHYLILIFFLFRDSLSKMKEGF